MDSYVDNDMIDCFTRLEPWQERFYARKQLQSEATTKMFPIPVNHRFQQFSQIINQALCLTTGRQCSEQQV